MPRHASALLKPVQPDATLAAIVGTEPKPRGDIMSAVWTYIKSNGLQSGRTINPDEKLAAFFGSAEPCDMLTIAKAISVHVTKVEG